MLVFRDVKRSGFGRVEVFRGLECLSPGSLRRGRRSGDGNCSYYATMLAGCENVRVVLDQALVAVFDENKCE